MKWAASQPLRWLLRFALSAVFVYAGLSKLRDPQAFAESIASFRLLPPALVNPAAMTLPPLEILAAALALSGGWIRRSGAFCLLATLIVFSLALASALFRGLSVDCGCFGADRLDVLNPTKNLWIAFLRDAVLIALAWTLYTDAKKTPRQREALPGRDSGTTP